MRDAVVPAGARGFNYDVVEGPIKTAATASRVVALAQTLPMMAQRRLVYVRELGAPSGNEADQLLAYVAKPNPSTVIVAVTGKLDKRLKIYSTLSKKGFVH